MGLFSTFSSKSSTSVPSSSGSRSRLGQHGSRRGEINKSEEPGLKRDIRNAFHGSKKETINSMIKSELDRGSGAGRRPVVTRDEAEGIIKDISHIYSKHDADKLRDLLAKRQG